MSAVEVSYGELLGHQLERDDRIKLAMQLSGQDPDELTFDERAEWVAPLATNGNGGGGPRLVSLDEIAMRDIDWLDEGFVPASTLTLLQGHGGTGKGPWTNQLAARVTLGQTPNGQAGRVLFAVAEDDYGSVLKPRLVAAGSDMRLVQVLEDVTLPQDIGWIEQQIVALSSVDEIPVRLLVIDPILTHIGDRIDTYKDHEVKRALRSLVSLCERRQVTTVGVLHFTKDTSRGSSFSGQASGAFRNTPRSVLSMAIHDEDSSVRLVEVSKSNFGVTGQGRRYQIELVSVDGLEKPQVVLRHEGDADKTVDAALKGSAAKEKEIDRPALRELILKELEDGPKSLDHLKTAGMDGLDVTGNAVYTVATELKKEKLVRCRKLGLAGWVWERGQKFELSGAAGDDDGNGLDSELSAELPRDDVDKSLNVRTSVSVESTQKFEDEVPF